MGRAISAALMANPEERARRSLRMKKLSPAYLEKQKQSGLKPYGGHGVGHQETNSERILKAMFPEALYNFCVPTGKSSKRHQPHIYYLDFAWLEIKLDVEVDGYNHHTDNQRAKDQVRDQWLKEHGWLVLRFSNGDVLRDTTKVQKHIESIICKLKAIHPIP